MNEDLLHKELTRVSEWVRFADQKAGFISVLYTALIGFLISNEDKIYDAILNTYCLLNTTLSLLVVAEIVCLVVGLVALFKVVFPTRINPHTNETLFYFGTVANKKIQDFLKEVKSIPKENIEEGLAEQLYTNSLIANKKMNAIAISIKFLFASATVLLFIILILNHYQY